MFIADVSMEYLSFRGVPLYKDGEYMVFVSEMPYHMDETLKNGELLSVPKKAVKTYKPLFKLHTVERFSILHILDENQKQLWKETLMEMFANRGVLIASLLKELSIEQLLVFIDLWEAGDLMVESDVLLHHHEQEGIITVELSSEEWRLRISELLKGLAQITIEREQNIESIFQELKARLSS